MITARFPYGFECVHCKRTFERLLEAQVHCCPGDELGNLVRIYSAPPPPKPWWRRLWDWLQIDSR